MSRTNPPHRKRRTTSSERAELLRDFDRSGLSAAAFARKHQINYTTFCGWRKRWDEAPASSGKTRFVEVELPPRAAPSHLIVEVGAKVRLRISGVDQVPLAAALLNQLAWQEEAC